MGRIAICAETATITVDFINRTHFPNFVFFPISIVLLDKKIGAKNTIPTVAL